MDKSVYRAFLSEINSGSFTMPLYLTSLDSEGNAATIKSYDASIELDPSKHWFVSPVFRRPGAVGRGKKADLVGGRWLYVDIDFKHHDITPLEFLSKSSLPDPTMTTMSGGGFHLWWKLDKAAPWQNIESRLKALSDTYPEVDPAVAHAAAMVRIPGTINHKYGTLVTFTHRAVQYPLSEFPEAIASANPTVSTEQLPDYVGEQSSVSPEALADYLVREYGATIVTATDVGIELLRPGNPESARSAIVFYESDRGWPMVQVFTSGWEGLPEGTYDMTSLMELNAWIPELEEVPDVSEETPESPSSAMVLAVREREFSAEVDRQVALRKAASVGLELPDNATLGMIHRLLKVREDEDTLKAIQGTGAIPSLNLLTAGDILRKELPPVTWAIEDLLGWGVDVKLAAKSKVGKTSLVMTLANALASGTQFLGYNVPHPLKVLILDFEMTYQQLQLRYLKNISREASENLYIECLRETGEELDLYSDSAKEELREKMRQLDVQFLIVDPLRDAAYASKLSEMTEGDVVNSNDAMTALWDSFTDISPPGGVMVVHHMGEGEAGTKSMGASTLAQKPSANWSFWNDKKLKTRDDEPVKHLRIEARQADSRTLSAVYDVDTGMMEIYDTDGVTGDIRNKARKLNEGTVYQLEDDLA